MATTIPAVVSTAPQNGQIQWQHKQIPSPRQPKGAELLVRILAAGICHTDIFCSAIPEGMMGFQYPKVFGHEGAGVVEAVGPDVKVAKPGDRVLLSYTYCGDCELCNDGKLTYCENFGINSVGQVNIFPSAPEDDSQKGYAGKFFGQSSFASLTLVEEKSVVNVHELVQTNEELERYAPLGCGLMTGAGAVLNNMKAHDIVVVIGIGAVGAGAIMAAAKIVGCKAVIAVDRVTSRLHTAKNLGATHTYNTSGGGDFMADVQALVDGQRIAFAIDTTGVISLMEKAVETLGKRGKLIQIGVPDLTKSVSFQMSDFFLQTKSFEINYLGDSKASEMIPKMIQWHKDGRFPFDEIMKFYPATDVLQALEDMKVEVMKPVLKF